MLKKICIIFLILLFPIVSNAADVTVKAFVYKDYTIYNYAIEFKDNNSISKFSFEKSKDAKIDYAVDKFGPIDYEIAGDYFIFKPDSISNNYFLIKVRSNQASENLFLTDSFRTYLNFDFSVESLIFIIDFKEDFGEILDVFPFKYSSLSDSKIEWEYGNVSKESLFVVNFEDIESLININSKNLNEDLIYLTIISILVIIIIFLSTFYVRKEKINNKTQKDKKNTIIEKLDLDEQNQIDKKDSDLNSKIENPPNNQLSVEDIVDKLLTDNESEVLLLIKDNEGISQFDILNYLPKISKSNLSKIISKLDSRKILKRIKVGKVNKIYLGDKVKR